ncbi:N-ethylmaleimide reductase [Faunimonas pinastri]|uniref:N-ethylmaleimide reductase n=1 Tax=Faunimonas pinastri TaxID=1855383 RepID=A0A1H9A1T6_9HYPH|nr:alkene reductase [Faunimonas pinastri]SEP70692.1 N-ethylmaleimide reductase [Faunimonas pinastri]
MTSNLDPLFQAGRIGDIPVANRIAMAPLTRSRAGEGNVPSDLAVTYYKQRASAGLIIAEATQIRPDGQGYIKTPGIHSPEQIAGWRRVNESVHNAGGRIILQLWHVGRISHTSLQPNNGKPLAPSAIRAETTKTFTKDGYEPVSEPRAIEIDEISGIVADYAKAAQNAIEAGFDGVEIHGANGYLIDQFLRDGTNKRTDAYGGSIENRVRFMREVTEAVIGVIGPGRTGIRLSPVTPANDATDSDPQPLFNLAVDELQKLDLAFIHVIEGATGGPRDTGAPFDYSELRRRFKGAYIANNGYDGEMAAEAIASGRADMVAFGRPFIANPDLVERLRTGAPLVQPDQQTMYGGGAEGYVDYPTLKEQAPA